MLDTFGWLVGSVAMFDTSAGGGPAGLDWGRYLVVCTGLISLILLGGMGARRLVRRSVVARANRRSIQVHDVLPLGGKQRLCVVRCYDRTFVLGLGDREVTLVGELEPDTDLSRTREPEPAPQKSAAAPARSPRAEALARMLAGSQAEGSERKAQFADLLRRLGEVPTPSGDSDDELRAAPRRAASRPTTSASPAREGGPARPEAAPVERPAAATPARPTTARPTTVAEALRGEGLLG